jgi:hypothetical protein
MLVINGAITNPALLVTWVGSNTNYKIQLSTPNAREQVAKLPF